MLTEIKDLGKLTLVTGLNNTGKSQALLGLLPYAPCYLGIERIKDKIVDDKNNVKEIAKELEKIFEITNYSKINIEGVAIKAVMPIIVKALGCTNEDLIIIDKPELGLHPKMQSNLIKFLALVSSTGVRIVLETHSDHILNGARIAVLNKVLNYEDLVIYHYSRDKEKVKIAVDKDGKITQWEDDFFDQLDKDYAELFKPIC